MTNLYFPICAFFCSLLILIVFFSKKRIKNDETKLFSGLLVTSFIDTILMILIIYIAYVKPDSYSLQILNRLDFFQYIFWTRFFFLYFYSITSNSKEKNKKISKITLIFNIIISLFIIILPLYVHTKNDIMYASGPSVNIVYITCLIYFISILITVLLNIRKIKEKRFLPLIALIFLALILLIVRKYNPGLLIIPAVLTYIDMIMMFTIENPDVRMIYELNRNKKLMESMNEEKSNFLFSMSQETRKPIDNILNINKIIMKENNPQNTNEGIMIIDNNARELKNIINNVLDITDINSSKLVVSNETYNFYTLINTCIKRAEASLKSNITLRTNISKNVPKELFGDSIKLKQVITAILSNAIKFTDEGYIDVTVNEIVKYDVCRLIIEIEDSGIGINPQKLNELLKSSSNLEDTDMLKLDNIDIDLKLAFKLINKMGGYINIKSEENVGSTFTIVIDQKIKIEQEVFNNTYLFNSKKVIVVSDNINFVKSLNKLSEKYEFELLTTMYSNDLIQRINSGEIFDVVILSDEMKNDSAVEILKKIKKIDKFNKPVIVVLNDNKKAMKQHYLNDGFNDYIVNTNIEEDYDRIVKKYL